MVKIIEAVITASATKEILKPFTHLTKIKKTHTIKVGGFLWIT